MRSPPHGVTPPDPRAALIKHQHACHTLLELSEDSTAPEELANNPPHLLPLLPKKQWHLVTSDADFIQKLYEHKIAFPGIIILLLESPSDDPRVQATAI